MGEAIDIDVEVLGRTVGRPAEGLRLHASAPDDLIVRDSTIKRFELCYLQCIRVLERFLREHAPVAPDSDASFRDLITAGHELGLTHASFEDWIVFRKARNKAAHTYLDEVINEIVGVAQQFLPEAQLMLDNVTRRLER